MRILLLGAPGVGKGTQAKLISEHFNIPHISTGDLFRLNIDNLTPLGAKAKTYIAAGKLVPDDLTISMVKERLSSEDCNRGFLLDGFPRNFYQAKELEDFLSERMQKIDRAILIDIPELLIMERITGRRVCSGCGENYHTKFKPSKVVDKCEVCGEGLIQRSDDREEVVKERLHIHSQNITPIVDYYCKIGRLFKINGDSEVSDVFSGICNLLQADI